MKEYIAKMDALLTKLRDYTKTKEGDGEAKTLYDEAFAYYSEILLNEGKPISEVIKMFDSDILNSDYEQDLMVILHNIREKSLMRGAK